MSVSGRMRVVFVAIIVAVCSLLGQPSLGADTRVEFDIPAKMECRDVTPEKCAHAHPNLKVIEAKFRISASFIEGTEASIVDFVYMISSPEMRMKIQDYLPNTTLESTLADDTIEVADTTESSAATSEEAHVAYQVFNLGGSKNQATKKTASDKYRQIVPRALVLASGTTNREHGVFFKLRPSKAASLEGGKEFTFLAIVPRNWRGDWCTVVCAARATKKSRFAPAVTLLAGIEQAHVGLYMTGDQEASDLAEKLCAVQEANGGVLSKQMARDATRLAESMHATNHRHSVEHYEEVLHGLVKFKLGSNEDDKKLAEAQTTIAELQDRLGKLAGSPR